jgi:coproporphyrinogen III oxidase-like Fe-S oxidoreductase
LESARIVDAVDAESREVERMMLGLRTNVGVPREWCSCEDATIDDLEAEGFATVHEGQIRLTDRGFLITNEIMLRLSSR